MVIVGISGYLVWQSNDNKKFINFNKEQDAFLTLTTQGFSKNLSLEEGFKIVLPSVRKWSKDAVLQKYMTNIINNKLDYKVLVYEFYSLSKKKILLITFNIKAPIIEDKFIGFNNPEEWELNNKFYVQEVNWPFVNGERLDEIKTNLAESNFNHIDNFVTSEDIIKIAKSEGLENFISNFNDYKVESNLVTLFENSTENNIEWIVEYIISKDNSPFVQRHVFMARFNPFTGNIINKVIK
jgi:hypothetical protein